MSYIQPHILNLNDRIQAGLDRGDTLVLIITDDNKMYLKLEEPK
uniref:Uncharacterized protein n=1 Tax=Pseudomonas phage RVTF4 TaxID=3236931 RepID=A0AB39CCK9_9VIRU